MRYIQILMKEMEMWERRTKNSKAPKHILKIYQKEIEEIKKLEKFLDKNSIKE